MENSESPVAESVTKEIIIKCSVEEMMRAFFKDYVIVWHDPNVNNNENQKYIAQLKKFCQITTFTEWEKAASFIRGTRTTCHVVTSGTNGELLVKEISKYENVSNLYIFCKNEEYHSSWAHHKKISCIEKNIQSLISQIQQNLLQWYKKASSFKLNLPAFAPIFNDNDKSQMNHLHRYLKIIPNFKNREQAKTDFLTLSRGIYSDPFNTKLLEEFEGKYNEYDKEQALRWYTQESFVYKVTNNCLRIATSDSIQYCRLVLKDIEQAIKDQYQAKSKDFNGLLYRGAYLSQKEWENLKENQDKEIEMHGFLSVSKEKNIAINFLKSDPSKKVLITIAVLKGPNEEEQGFAEVEKFSQYPVEKEVLFNVRSRFTVLETDDKYMYSGISRCRHLVLLYGAQGLRKYITEQNSVKEVSIPDIEDLSCAHCTTKSERFLLASIAEGEEQDRYYCKTCIEYEVGPFLCILIMDKAQKSYTAKIKGCFLMNADQSKTPFYGYKCCVCETKKRKAYFVCTDCNGKKWCEHCFEGTSTRLDAGHNILLETSPYSFWCEKMSPAELNHLKFQQNLLEGFSTFQQAEMYFENHQYEKAKEYYSLYIEQNKNNLKDPNLAISYDNIGSVYDSQGKYKKALEYYLKSLETYKAIHGNENHPDIASSYNHIGNMSYQQGEYNKALEYYFKSLEITKSASGDSHLESASTYHNIGLIYKKQGEDKKALEYLLKSLDIEKSLHGESHPAIANSYDAIGLILSNQREYEKALEYHLNSLEIRKALYGDSHPGIANSFHILGNVYQQQGKSKKALKYQLKSLNIRKAVYGESHPDVATSYFNLGNVYKDQREDQKALEYYSKSLDIRKEENHPDTATTFNNMGSVFSNKGDYKKAIEYYQKALEIRKSVYGENHPDVAMSYHNLGLASKNNKEDTQALEYYLKSLEIRKSLYGENNHSIADSYNNIGSVYRIQGENSKALESFLKSPDVYKAVHGDNHPSVATAYNNIGSLHYFQAEYKKALEYCLKALEIRKAVYGDDHPNTIKSKHQILKLQSIGQNNSE